MLSFSIYVSSLTCAEHPSVGDSKLSRTLITSNKSAQKHREAFAFGYREWTLFKLSKAHLTFRFRLRHRYRRNVYDFGAALVTLLLFLQPKKQGVKPSVLSLITFWRKRLTRERKNSFKTIRDVIINSSLSRVCFPATARAVYLSFQFPAVQHFAVKFIRAFGTSSRSLD